MPKRDGKDPVNEAVYLARSPVTGGNLCLGMSREIVAYTAFERRPSPTDRGHARS